MHKQVGILLREFPSWSICGMTTPLPEGCKEIRQVLQDDEPIATQSLQPSMTNGVRTGYTRMRTPLRTTIESRLREQTYPNAQHHKVSDAQRATNTTSSSTDTNNNEPAEPGVPVQQAELVSKIFRQDVPD